MRRIVIVISFFLVQSLFQSCCWTGDCNEIPEPISSFKPIIMDRTAFESSVKLLPSQNLVKSGKIYIKDDLMLLNDVNKGFHVYNYSNPENPVKIAFIEIPGATDVAIRNSTIYINQAVDLVTLNYNSNTNTLTVLSRNRNIFPQKRSPDGFVGNYAENQIIVNWILN